MLDILKNKKLPETMLKHLMFFALFFPVFTSSYDSPYAPDLIAVNVFAFLFVAAALLQGRTSWRGQALLSYLLLGLLAVYNLAALRANRAQLDWYSSQFNMTVPFLMLAVLLRMEKDPLGQDESLIRFFLQAVVVSNVLGLLIYFLGNYGVWFMNGKIGLIPVEPSYYERRCNWIYNHKSQYAFFLLLQLALVMTYRRMFRSKWTYFGSLAVLLAGLVVSNTVTSIFASLFIILGRLADRVFWKDGKFLWKRLLWLIPAAAVLAVGLYLVGQKRDLSTLGGRSIIWKAGLNAVLENPLGTGRMCGLMEVEVFSGYAVNNCHNVFLNLLLQFSTPAGLAVIAMVGVIFLASVKRNLRFATLGTWAALLTAMMMDWCILLTDWPLFLLTVYYLFFSPMREEGTT